MQLPFWPAQRKWTFAFAAVLVSCARGAEAAVERRELIVNGVNAAAGRYPWFVSLRNINPDGSYTHSCGGTLIDDRLILTAAHCFGDPGTQTFPVAGDQDFLLANVSSAGLPPAYAPGEQWVAVVSAQDPFNGILRNISLIIVHPQYDPQDSYHNDVAVMILTTPLPLHPKVKLYESTEDVYSNIGPIQNLTAIGLGNYVSDFTTAGLNGSRINNDPNQKLREVVIGPLTDREPCGVALTAYNNFSSPDMLPTILNEGQFCAGAATRADPQEVAQVTQAANAFTSLLTGASATAAAAILRTISIYNDTCQGDSGGPLFVKGSGSDEDVQYGVVSNGPGCGFGFAGVYTNVQAFFQPSVYDNFLSVVTSQIPGSNADALTSALAPAPSLAVSPGTSAAATPSVASG